MLRQDRDANERGSCAYAAASIALSISSVVAFGLYQQWHADLIRPLQPNELAWVVGMAKTVSELSACCAVLMSAIAMLRGPRLIGAASAVLALMSCVTIPVTF